MEGTCKTEAMIKVSNKVPIYEVNGKEVNYIDESKLVVESHWNENDKVVLKFGRRNITVVARDLTSAIDNATNTRRF